MTAFLIFFGAGIVVQFIWHLAREYEKQTTSQQQDWVRFDEPSQDIVVRELIGKIHALEMKRDQNRIGTREYEALDLEAYETRRVLADLTGA